MALEYTDSYLKDTLEWLRAYKKLGERAMAQVSDEQLTATLDPEMNSIAILVKHMAGNMRSRWGGFPEADGESGTRDRDAEFVDPPGSRAELMAMWEEGWRCVFAALEPLADTDLARKVTVRGEAHSILQAINRQYGHYAYHAGQIVFLAKHLQSSAWKALTIPRGKSQEYNRKVLAGEASQR